MAALLAVAGSSFTGCALLAPTSRDDYLLLSINGDTLPANSWEGQDINGRLGEHRILSWKVTLFEGGQFAWDIEFVNLIDGAPDPEFPDTHDRKVGRYEQSDTNVVLQVQLPLEGYFTGDTLFLIDDVQGYTVFQFVRR